VTDLQANGPLTSAPLVSVIIPCWNGEQFLSEAISSALAQTHERVEVIFVDDGSSDKSLQIAQLHPTVKILSQANSGVSIARNSGFRESTGDFIIFLDADDRLEPEAVEMHLNAFTKMISASMVYGSNRIIGPDGNTLGLNLQIEREFSWRDVLMGVTPTPSQSMFRRSAIELAGGFDPNVRLGEDFDLYLKVTNIRPGYCHKSIVVDYRRHSQQATKQPSASLTSMLGVIDRFSSGNSSESYNYNMLRTARRHWKIYYGQYIPFEFIKNVLNLKLNRSVNSIRIYLGNFPETLLGSLLYIVRRAGKLVAR
jgi:glycosyltransferase involved in cell wall biosynthesis